jgi:CubicO group peptidase (beta-lactamase class C family)
MAVAVFLRSDATGGRVPPTIALLCLLLPLLLTPRAAYGLSATAPSPGVDPEVAPELAGFSGTRLARVDSAIQKAILAGATPGAALAIARDGKIVRLRGYGRIDWSAGAAVVTDSTLYDIASLTKVVGTATAALLLIRDGRLHADAPLHRYLRTWPRTGQHARITIRHLLTHTSGLPAGLNLWAGVGTRDDRIDRIARARITSPPGTRRVYSDIGMILLAAIVEKISGERLDWYLEQAVFSPLAMHDTRFNPLRTPASQFDLSRIAPTEYDRTVRRRLVHGEVHDLNALALGGIAGHSGIFSSARDLAVFAQTMLDAALGQETPLTGDASLSALLVRDLRFGRLPGWDVPAGSSSSAGRYFSASSFGHTGFTGTSIWIDPERHLYVVLLTNRLNPTARNQLHVALRREVHDLVQLALLDPPRPRGQQE